MDSSCLQRPSFKQAVTVAKWLGREHLLVGSAEINWQGYVEYVFEHFSRTRLVPAVGQLKNPVLLKKYFQQVNISFCPPVRERSNDELEALYRRVLAPEISEDAGVLHLLGLIRSDRS